jgi:hypothetical protein
MNDMAFTSRSLFRKLKSTAEFIFLVYDFLEFYCVILNINLIAQVLLKHLKTPLYVMFVMHPLFHTHISHKGAF